MPTLVIDNVPVSLYDLPDEDECSVTAKKPGWQI